MVPLVALAVVCVLIASPAEGMTIRELQLSTVEQDWMSPYAGQTVSVAGGVVTHVAGLRITLQDPTLGTEWAGLEIRAYENEAPLGVVRVGDQVDFHDLLVEEFRGGTIPQFKSYSSFEVKSSGHPLPAPVVLTCADVAWPPDREACERYEGMLVTVEDVRVGRMDWGKAEDNYELTDGTSTVWASDYYNLDLAVPPFPKYRVSRGERYRRITGVLQEYVLPEEGWDYYQILPRGDADYERSDVYTVRDVQESTGADGWESLLAGRRVDVQGVVCAPRTEAGRLSLCDFELGPAWSGTTVLDPGGRLAPSAPGDEVLLRQVLVTEQDGVTGLLYDEASHRDPVGSGRGLLTWTVPPSALAAGAGPEVSERYEGVPVALYNLSVVRCGVAEGDRCYYLAAGADTVIGTDLDSGLVPPGGDFFVRPGDRLGRISGIVRARLLPGGARAYVLAPRSAADYQFAARPTDVHTTWGRLKAGYRGESR